MSNCCNEQRSHISFESSSNVILSGSRELLAAPPLADISIDRVRKYCSFSDTTTYAGTLIHLSSRFSFPKYFFIANIASSSSHHMPIPLQPPFLDFLCDFPTFVVSLILLFLIVSTFVTLHFHRSIRISSTSIFF